MYSEKAKNFQPDFVLKEKKINWSFPEKLAKVDSDNPVYADSESIFSESRFSKARAPICITSKPLEIAFPSEELYILRAPIRHKFAWHVPGELGFLKEFLELTGSYTDSNFKSFQFPFVYLTVRHGPQKDYGVDVWHTDGFQGNVKARHNPEHSYIWTDGSPTEWAVQPFLIPESFDPAKHNFFSLLPDQVDASKVIQTPLRKVHLFDPYMVHKKSAFTGLRSMIRLTYSPVEIMDPNHTKNKYIKTDYQKAEPRDWLRNIDNQI